MDVYLPVPLFQLPDLTAPFVRPLPSTTPWPVTIFQAGGQRLRIHGARAFNGPFETAGSPCNR
ncbi:hypothetical protein DSCA_44510 [Desulfosarcina alkanivorans]|uniref:Uncharacterized protein n=1 Tax=Desulfosarcina alkanivorans TaxID=571177 RepID=A0A5K7YTZ6_9BACT|nr:hypothetical protein DSCA_44510 [Desulfosarcina alkanivorans]